MAPIDENINETRLNGLAMFRIKQLMYLLHHLEGAQGKKKKVVQEPQDEDSIFDDDFFEEKETCLALESQIWDCLTDPLVPTTQRLEGEDKDNQRTQNLLVITAQEQKILKNF